MTAEEYLINKIQFLENKIDKLEKENKALKQQIQDNERFHMSELLNINYQFWKRNNSYYFDHLKKEMPKKEYKLIKCDNYHTKNLVDLIEEFGYEMVEQWLTQDIKAELEKEPEEAEEDEEDE